MTFWHKSKNKLQLPPQSIQLNEVATDLTWVLSNSNKQLRHVMEQLSRSVGVSVPNSDVFGLAQEKQLGRFALASLVAEAFDSTEPTLLITDKASGLKEDSLWIVIVMKGEVIPSFYSKTLNVNLMSDCSMSTMDLEKIVRGCRSELKIVADCQKHHFSQAIKSVLLESFLTPDDVTRHQVVRLNKKPLGVKHIIAFGVSIILMGLFAYYFGHPKPQGESLAQQQAQIAKIHAAKRDHFYTGLKESIRLGQAYAVLNNVMDTMASIPLTLAGWNLAGFFWESSSPKIISVTFIRSDKGTLNSFKNALHYLSVLNTKHSLNVQFSDNNDIATTVLAIKPTTGAVDISHAKSSIKGSDQMKLVSMLQQREIPYQLGSRTTYDFNGKAKQSIRLNNINANELRTLISLAKANPFFTISTLSNTIKTNAVVALNLKGAIYE